MQPPNTLDPDEWTGLVDPDCKAGKHAICLGSPCACECHKPDAELLPDGSPRIITARFDRSAGRAQNIGKH